MEYQTWPCAASSELLLLEPWHGARWFSYVTCSYCFVFQICFFFSVFATFLRVLALAPKAFQLRGTFSFLPCSAFHVLVARRPLQLSLSSKRLITVREPDSRGRGWGRPDRMMEGWWVGQGAKLSPALAGSGRRDADGTLWPRTVSLCGSVSAAGPCQRSLSCSLLPLSSLFGYCRSVSLRVCVCVTHGANMRPRRGSLGEVCEVNQGDLLFQGGGQPVASRKASTRRSEKDDTTPKNHPRVFYRRLGFCPIRILIANERWGLTWFPLAVLLISQFRELFVFCFL